MVIKKTINSPKANITVGVIMLIIALGLQIGGGYFVVSSAKKLDKFVRTEATVVDYEERRDTDSDGNRRTLYAEIVEYEVDGKTYTATSSSASNIPKSKGATIKIAYNPDNPNECIFVGNTVMVTVILFVMGVAFLAAGTFLTVGYIKTRKAQKAQKTESAENTAITEPGVKQLDVNDFNGMK